MATLRRRLLGVAFLLVVALFFTGTILIFNRTFTTFTTVTLTTDTAGNALPENADVKARGVIVGQVRAVDPSEDGTVEVTLGLTPEMADQLPLNTTARILPKTLFGERFISLQIPEQPSGERLSNGAIIRTDASGNAQEIQDLLDRLLPILEQIPPQDLSATLTSLSQALAGRGEQLGTTIENLNTVFSRVNANLPELQGTLRGLASFSDTYSEAVPYILDALDNLRVTTNTLDERQGDLRALISTLGTAAVDTSSWLHANGDNVVDLVIESEPFITGLAKQSPAFKCTFENFGEIAERARTIVGEGDRNPGIRVNVKFLNPKGRYLPNQDEPRLFDNRPARCYGEATDGRPFPQYPGGSIADGSYQIPSRNPGPRNVPDLPRAQYGPMPAGNIGPSTYNDPAVNDQLRLIYGGSSGNNPQDVPGWVTWIGGPSLIGAEVRIQ